jgi:hypothetical protein
MNTRSDREHTKFEPAQLLRNWREQRPINQGYLDSSVTGRLVESVTLGGHASDLIFVPENVIVVGFRCK